MIELFGKAYRLDRLLFSVIFIFSVVIISFNILYAVTLGSSIMNMNMGIGCILLIYSAYHLFGSPSYD